MTPECTQLSTSELCVATGHLEEPLASDKKCLSVLVSIPKEGGFYDFSEHHHTKEPN